MKTTIAKLTSKINRDCNILGSFRGCRAGCARQVVQRMNSAIARRRLHKAGYAYGYEGATLVGDTDRTILELLEIAGRTHVVYMDSHKSGFQRQRLDNFLRAQRVTEVR